MTQSTYALAAAMLLAQTGVAFALGPLDIPGVPVVIAAPIQTTTTIYIPPLQPIAATIETPRVARAVPRTDRSEAQRLEVARQRN